MYRVILALLLFAGPALLDGAALAQTNHDAPSEIPPGFQPVRGAPDVAKIDPNPLVVGAYAVFFLGIFGYVVYLARRQADIAKEMEALAAQIQKVDRT